MSGYSGILYDDASPNLLKSTTQLLLNQYNFDIPIEHPPREWDEDFIEELAKHTKKKDCIVLDWRLDQFKSDKGEMATYKASELSQLIRRKAAEGEFRPVPVFLWSIETNLGHSYDDDFTSHDLFDRIYTKDKDLVSPDIKESALEMIYFIHLYRFLRKLKDSEYSIGNVNTILGLVKKNQHWLDATAKEYFMSKTKTKNISKVVQASRIIYNDLIKKSGILIGEKLLGVRLGVDIHKSSDWQKLLHKQEIVDIMYKGFFESSKHRKFWMQGLYELWDNVAPTGKSLLMTPTDTKVLALIKKFRLKNLEPLKGDGKQFWYLSKSDHRPLDPNHAKAVSTNSIFPWQDPIYTL